MYRNDDWLSFEDIESIKARGRLIEKYGLAGARLYGLDQDDVDNRCKSECAYPLTRAIRNAIGNDVDCSFESNTGVMLLNASSFDVKEEEPSMKPAVDRLSSGRSVKEETKEVKSMASGSECSSVVPVLKILVLSGLIKYISV